MAYHVVYDVTQNWLTLGVVMAVVVPGILVTVGGRLALFPASTKIPAGRIFRWFWFLAVLTFALLAWSVLIIRHFQLVEVLRQGKCTTVEGTIDNFVPMPGAGHADEHFTVAGVPFAYSDYVLTGGLNNTAAFGGPARAGRHVRICYLPQSGSEKNVILRMEAAD